MMRNIKLLLKSLILCSTQLIKFVFNWEKKKKSKIIEKSLLRMKKKKNEILSELFCNNLGQDTKTPCFAEVLKVTRCKKNQGVLSKAKLFFFCFLDWVCKKRVFQLFLFKGWCCLGLNWLVEFVVLQTNENKVTQLNVESKNKLGIKKKMFPFLLSV